MCWNPDISMNTFIFTIFALLFIYLTNTYSKYKTETFKNPLMYLFFFEVALIQLLEYFLWKNLKNNKMNKLLSKLVCYVIILQPFTLMLMIPIDKIKYFLLSTYIIFIILYDIIKTKYNPNIYYTSIGKNGHLSWEWMNYKGYENILFIIYLLFYSISSLFINNFLFTIFLIVSLLLSLINYFKFNTFGSMWCWYSNLFLLYFIINILIIKPYYEYNKLC